MVKEGFKVIFRNEIRFEGSLIYSVWNQENDLGQKRQIAMDSYLTAWLLSECQYYIGTFGSNLARGAMELMVGKRGVGTITTGVDYPWNERVLK